MSYFYFYSVMHVLITGGAGFIGSHLVERFLNEGHKVTVWDNLFTGQLENLAAVRDKIIFEEHDIRFEKDFDGDVIINLACPAAPEHYQKDPVYTWETSVIGIHNLLKVAQKRKLRIMQASTSEVYGDPLEHPQSENYWGHVNPIGIRSCYDEGKRAAETIIFDYMRKYNMDARVFRIFNTYGPRMVENDGRVVVNFCLQALRGEAITMYGDGSQTRAFCFVSDLVDAIYKMFSLPESLEGPINIGNENEFTIRQLAELVIKISNCKSEMAFLPLPADDPKQRKPNLTRAKEILQWQAKVELEEGLKKTLEYFKDKK